MTVLDTWLQVIAVRGGLFSPLVSVVDLSIAPGIVGMTWVHCWSKPDALFSCAPILNYRAWLYVTIELGEQCKTPLFPVCLHHWPGSLTSLLGYSGTGPLLQETVWGSTFSFCAYSYKIFKMSMNHSLQKFSLLIFTDNSREQKKLF